MINHLTVYSIPSAFWDQARFWTGAEDRGDPLLRRNIRAQLAYRDPSGKEGYIFVHKAALPNGQTLGGAAGASS